MNRSHRAYIANTCIFLKPVLLLCILLAVPCIQSSGSAQTQIYNITTLAGSGIQDYPDGTGNRAGFDNPSAITSDGAGNLYVTDAGNNRIRKVVISTGEVTTLAGDGITGNADGVGSASRFASPLGITNDGIGSLYVTDTGNHRIRKITLTER